jgi:hypothetical protein
MGWEGPCVISGGMIFVKHATDRVVGNPLKVEDLEFICDREMIETTPIVICQGQKEMASSPLVYLWELSKIIFFF